MIVGVSMVRNEADVIEAFVRHNLGLLDRLLVVDHRSDDGTSSILSALVDEGLPLQVERFEGEAQIQPETITRLAREAFASGASTVIPLDGDEFLKLPDRAAFLRAVAQVEQAGADAVLRWQTYVPPPGEIRPGGMGLTLTHRRAAEAHGLYKVVLARRFASLPTATVGPGNHVVLAEGPGHDLARKPARLGAVPETIAAIAHLPVRSAAQIRRKVAVGWAAHVAAARRDPNLAFHWRELHEEFELRGDPDDRRLTEIALNYGIPMQGWQPATRIPVIADPLPTIALRHSPDRC